MLGDEQWTISDSDTRLRSVLTYTDTELATVLFPVPLARCIVSFMYCTRICLSYT